MTGQLGIAKEASKVYYMKTAAQLITRRLLRPLIIAACTANLLSAAAGQQTTAKPSANIHAGQPVVSRAPTVMLAQLSDSLRELAGKVSPAVVQIEVSGFGLAEKDRKETTLIVRQHAIGAGVIVDPDGYIMTNAHVVAGAQRIRVVLSAPPATFDPVAGSGNVQVLEAKIVGLQEQVDLALLKVNAVNLPTLHFRLDRDPQPGELVFAVGSPDGLQNSVSMGVISSALRQPNPDNPMVYLQTDAPINPGNSGGPLVDVTGDIVGLNTFILSTSGGSEGLGFAIPARIVDFVYRSLRQYGHVHRTEIGVVAQTITPTMAEGLGLAQNRGVLIADVLWAGPACLAGIEPGDIFLAVDGTPMRSLTGFAIALYLHAPDQPVQIDIQRGERKLSVAVPAVLARDRMDQIADVADPTKSLIQRLGILGIDLKDEMASLVPDVRISSGVIVVGQARGFDSVDAGLQAGDLIHSLNRTPIESVEQLRSAVAQLKPGDAGVLRIERQGQFQYLAFEME